jgi:hypothetical protein
MGHLSIEFVKRNCVFRLRIEEPLQTLSKLADFFAARRIIIHSLHLEATVPGEATLMLYCLIEKDRILHTRHALEKMKGVLELVLLEHKETNCVKT